MSQQTAITPTRTENYPAWYQQVIQSADLAEHAPVRGCMVIKPWGYAIWEQIQQDLDRRIKETGHVNAYFPLLIPVSFLEKEAQHINGFAKECAVVTHHRLKATDDGQLVPDGELEEPFIIRPTSETIIGEVYSKWVQSYRDLPIMINQWANVMRWEMRTRLFLRTSEFLWQEGHTAHATAQEGRDETEQMLNVYQDFARETLAIPVIPGQKPLSERFPGAQETYTIEAMMQDGKALQAGTSHFMGQTFAKAYEIKYLSKEGQLEYAWTTSWGVTTRLIGALVMTHSDDNGLVLPPSVAPYQIVINPILGKTPEEENAVLDFCTQLRKDLSSQKFNGVSIRVHVDKRDIRGGEKNWQWIKKGVPVRIEVGPRDLAQGTIMVARRDASVSEKQSYSVENLLQNINSILTSIQNNLLNKAATLYQIKNKRIQTVEELEQLFAQDDEKLIAPGFVECFLADDLNLSDVLKKFKATPRCIPLDREREFGVCILTGKENSPLMLIAKAY